MTSSARRKTSAKGRAHSGSPLYTLAVLLTDGPISKKFGGKTISRTVQILGRQTLADLHGVIFDAFDRDESHLYEFNLGQGPSDRSRLFPPDGFSADDSTDSPRKTKLDSLDLRVGQLFGYTFDMGDNWQHAIEVRAIEPCAEQDHFPTIIERLGTSPPQYADLEEE